MVDFIVSSPTDNKSLVGNPQTGAITDTSSGNGRTLDDIANMAQDVGLVDTMNQINAGQDPFNKEQGVEESLEDSVKPDTQEKRESRRRKENRFDKFNQQLADAQRERDTYAERLNKLEFALLKKNHEALDSEIESVADSMRVAVGENDTDSFTETQKRLAQLTAQQALSEQNLKQAQQFLEDSQREEEFDPRDVQSKEILYGLSHPRELRSEDYYEWLDDHPVFDPFAPDFNPDLAQDLVTVKKEFNNFLSYQGNADVIGTEDYYKELDKVMDAKQRSKYSAFSSQINDNNPPQRSNPMSSPSYAETPVSAVNRSGYNAPYQHGRLPELSAAEEQIALICPIPAGPPKGHGDIPRLLSSEERIMEYRKQKARVMGMR